MGVVRRQSVLNTLLLYAGMLLGYLNVVLLFPRLVSEQEFGVTRIILNLGILLNSFTQLGTSVIMVRYFPHFNNKQKKHYGLLTICLLLVSIAIVIVSILLYIFKNKVLHFYDKGNSVLFEQYYYLLVPLITGFGLSTVLIAYYQALQKSYLPTFTREVATRLATTFLIIAYYFKVMSLTWFLTWFVFIYVFETIYLCFNLYKSGDFLLGLNFEKWKAEPNLKTEMASFGFFTWLSTFLYTGIINIDVLLVGVLLGEKEVAYYSVAAFFGSVVLIPTKALTAASVATFSEALKEKKYDFLRIVYQKTTESQLVVTCGVSILLLCNLHNLYALLDPSYAKGMYVVIFIVLAKILDTFIGQCGSILSDPKYYKVDFGMWFFLLVLISISTYLGIMYIGITGAALAMLFSFAVMNSIKVVFLWRRLQINIFYANSFKILLLFTMLFLLSFFIKPYFNFVIDGIIRSMVIGAIYVWAVFKYNLSADIVSMAHLLYNKYLKKGNGA